MRESELFAKYKSSYNVAVCDLSVHVFLKCSLFYYLWYLRNSWLSIFTVSLFGLMNCRTFIVFHDCGHNSYTPSKSVNYIIGSIFGIFVFTPISWNWQHGNHHLTSGNTNNKLNHKYNELTYQTLTQYKRWNWFEQRVYRIARHPFLFLAFGPVLFFGIKQRTDMIRYKLGKKYKFTQSISQILFETILSNVSIIVFIYELYNLDILGHYLFGVYIFAISTFCVFHNQHTFNPSYITDNNNWTQRNSGLLGSSFIQIPWVFKYFLMGIEYHHIHHINSKIPGYNLQAYHEEVVSKSNMFDNIVKLSMSDCYNNMWLVLYDEDNQRYITFAEADEDIRKKGTQ